MNAVMRKHETQVDVDMAANESNDQATQIAELRADVRHIQSDVTDLKTELRATSQRVDGFVRLEKRFDELKDSLASAKIWALGLYGSLLYLMARGFKWL
jgi:predicted nuclease with TOPRIM domain